MRSKFYSVPFGFSGDKAAIPNAVQLDGSVSYTQAWGADYQRDQATDPLAKDIDRQNMNSLLNGITDNLRTWQMESFPEFVNAADNDGVAIVYEKGVIVRWRAVITDPLVNYVSLIANNSGLPSDAAKWAPYTPCVTAPQFDNDLSTATTEFVQRALGNYRGAYVLGGSKTITAGDIGMLIINGNFTLPTPVSIGASVGASVSVMCTSAGGTVVAPGAGATLYSISSIPSLNVMLGQYVEFVAVSATGWQIINSTATLQDNAMFAASLATNGYQKLPSGLIMQWGANSGTSSGPLTYGFPVAFPNTCLSMVATTGNMASLNWAKASPVSRTQFQVGNGNGAGAWAADAVSWIALGY